MVFATAATNAMALDAAPEATVAPCTVTVAPEEVTVGVTVTDATLFATVEVYDVVPAAKATFSEPSLSTRSLNVLTVLSAVALLTVTVYVFVVVVSPAVAVTVIAVPAPPAATACADDVAPDATAALDPPEATAIVVPLSVAVGVTVTDAIEFTIDAVYVMVPEANAGLKAPELNDRALSVASLLSAAVRVTVTVYVLMVPSQPVDTTEIALPEPAVRA
jgi:hypothetical protein